MKAFLAACCAVFLACALVGCGSTEKKAEPVSLSFGQSAKVSDSLEITVNKVSAVSAKKLSRFGVGKNLRPYFVKVRVTNIGTSDLGGTAIPLYLQNASGTLISFSPVSGSFPACRSQKLPKKFAPQASLDTCLIYVLGKNDAATLVSYRPDQTKEPITWSGTIAGQKSTTSSSTKAAS